MKQTISVKGNDLNEFVKNVREQQEKGYIMVGLPLKEEAKYSCTMMRNCKVVKK